MKYFNPSYWLKLLILAAPIFNRQNKIVNSMPINKYYEIETTCAHEVGHMVNVLNSKSFVFFCLNVYDSPIIKKSDNTILLGETLSFFHDDLGNMLDEQIMDMVRISMGGLAGEKFKFNIDYSWTNISEVGDFSDYLKELNNEVEKRNLKIESFDKIPVINLWNFLKDSINDGIKVIEENKEIYDNIYKICIEKKYANFTNIDFFYKKEYTKQKLKSLNINVVNDPDLLDIIDECHKKNILSTYIQ